MAFLNKTGLERLWAHIVAKLGDKVDKVDGKGLSTNDYTTDEKNKLTGIEEGANKTTVDSALSSTSTNPVQNKVVNSAISNLNTLVGSTSVDSQIDSAIDALNLDTTYIKANIKGVASGVAELDSSGKVPSSQLPSYVDDVLEYSGKANFPSTGETGKIYVDTSTNLTYRWSGSAYVEISQSLALGSTSSTAFRGDYGTTAYEHATAKGSAFSSGLYKITTNDQGHVTATTAVTKSDITGLGIPAQDTTYSAATTSAAGLMSASDKSKLDGITASTDSVSFSANATSGNKVGTITINGTSTDMYSPTQTSVSGNAGTATKLATAKAIDGISFDGTANVTRYATCSTDAATVAKIASVTAGTFNLVTGAKVTIKFNYSNTAASPTLNVNGTGDKAIYWEGVTLKPSQYWYSGAVLDFTYDGTRWNLDGATGTAARVRIEKSDSTSSFQYNIPFLNGNTAGNRPVYANDGLLYITSEGTTDAAGSSVLTVGNATSSGTAGNKAGEIRIYGTGVAYTGLKSATTNGAYTVTFPAKGGTVALTSDFVVSDDNNGNVTISFG